MRSRGFLLLASSVRLLAHLPTVDGEKVGSISLTYTYPFRIGVVGKVEVGEGEFFRIGVAGKEEVGEGEFISAGGGGVPRLSPKPKMLVQLRSI